MDIKITYFKLLRAAIGILDFFEMKESVSVEKWQELLQLAQRQGTASVISDVLLSLPEEERPPKAMQTQTKAVCARSMMAQAEQKQVMQKAMKALQDGGITPVLLKGLGLARNYPKPYLRSCGDVDIYVGKENYHKGAKILRETFPDMPRFETEEDFFKHYNINVGSTAIEMHRVSAMFQHPKDAKVYDELEREGLQNNMVHYTDGEDEWNEPEWKFNVMFVFIHSWDHFVTESASMRQICDLTLLLHHHSDIAALERYLRTNLKKLHLFHAWQLYAYIMVNYLGLPKEQCPLYTNACAEKADRMLSSILHGREKIEQNDKPAPKNVILRKLYTLRERIRKAREIRTYESHYARHMVATAFAQSWERFKKGENTRKWE